ncbi:hypothetical protein N3K66_007215 [Trichothecium roseum]|uniref:Uncharacterized protein n=1 Tax=Trichothecium roseum TaxID=47278 RepID=A0ACC0UV18_9HYPO|nr:hypothetical protein N3K66_007215 [Trichothecium roseum]
MADIATKRLKLIESPLVDPDDHGETLAPRPPPPAIDPDASDFRRLLHRLNPPKDAPPLKRYGDASTLELFYDLFFAANYSIFSQTQSIKDGDSFKAYLGYFCTLWITWFMVTTYDVRFVADSVFERCARAVQIGVMVGFSVVSPRFDPSEQDVPTMRRLSAILSISRIVLAAEYGSIIWHTRKCRISRLPLYLQAAVNLCSAFLYVGTLFFFDDKHKTHAFVVWYITGGLEMAATMLLSNLWHVLSFTDTHLMKRMSLLTIIILGDAIVALAQDVVLIVKAPKAWTANIIGIVTAASTTIYLVFLCYFDWMKNAHLPGWRQQIWTTLHFPLHVSMVLFTQCIAQFVIWGKITETLYGFVFDAGPLFGDKLADATSESFRDDLVNITGKVFRDYPVINYNASQMLFLAYQNITAIPDSFWPKLSLWMNDVDAEFQNANDEMHFETVINTLDEIFLTMVNSIFVKFKVDVYGDLLKDKSNFDSSMSPTDIMNTIIDESFRRYFGIFSYGYTSAGLTLLIMTFLTIVSRLTPWRPWPLMRAVANILLGIGLSLVSLLRYSPYKQAEYLDTPWLVPAICLVWIVVVVMTHTHSEAAILHPEASERMLRSARAWFRGKLGMDRTYSTIEMTEQQTAYNGHGPS